MSQPTSKAKREAVVGANWKADGWSMDVWGNIFNKFGQPSGGVLISDFAPHCNRRFDTSKEAVEAGRKVAKDWGAGLITERTPLRRM